MPIRPIHVTGTPENDSVQAFDVRLYFNRDVPKDRLIDVVMDGLQDFPWEEPLISAYELVWTPAGDLVPDDKPLALAGNLGKVLDFVLGQRVYLP